MAHITTKSLIPKDFYYIGIGILLLLEKNRFWKGIGDFKS